MNIYATDYWQCFPTSEYGGLFVWCAESEDQIIQYVIDNLMSYEVNKITKESEGTPLYIEIERRLNVRMIGRALENQGFGLIEQFST